MPVKYPKTISRDKIKLQFYTNFISNTKGSNFQIVILKKNLLKSQIELAIHSLKKKKKSLLMYIYIYISFRPDHSH